MIIETPIVTERLLLRTLTVSDLGPHYVNWLADEEITRYLEVRFSQAQDLNALGEFICTTNKSSNNLLLGIFLKDELRHIGNIKLGSVCRHHNRADIGFLIGAREEWGKGYATEAIVAVAKYAMNEMHLAKLMAGCYESNRGSARAIEKAGFSMEARLHNHWSIGGKREDGLQFAYIMDPENRTVG